MAVSKREYIHPDTSKPAWGYDFFFDRKRNRRAGYRTQAEAERAEQQAREKLGAGKRLKPVRRLKFMELCDLYFEDYEKTKASRSVRRERYRANLLGRRFGEQFIDQIKVEQIARHVEQRAKDGIKARGTNLEVVLLRNLYRFAIAKGYAVDNPAKLVAYKPSKRTARSIPTPEEFARFIDEAGKTRTGQQMVVWLWVQTLTGMRPSESFFLEWADVDFPNGKIFVREKPEYGNPLKKDASREIEMHPRVKELLSAWREHRATLFDGKAPPHDWVFVHPAHPERRSDGFRTAYENARAKAGLPNLRRYDLRHMFCSFALMNKVDKDVLRGWMGHKSFQMIDLVYSHSLSDYRRGEMAKMQIDLPVVVNASNQIPVPESAAKS